MMQKPELVLSNTSTFFSGSMRRFFSYAKKLGFKYVEIVPYRWTKPEKILELSQRYQVKIAGIHLPNWWQKPFRHVLKQTPKILEKFFSFLFNIYLGPGIKNPGLALAAALPPKNPYLLFHTPLVADLGQAFGRLSRKFHIVIENVPYEAGRTDPFFWNPAVIQKEMDKRGFEAGLVFDPGHFNQTVKKLPRQNALATYRQIRPEVIHISYNSRGIHLLPSKSEREQLKQMLKIHLPRFITIETNPLVSVKKAKRMMEEILREVSG